MNESILEKAKASAAALKEKVSDLKDNLFDDEKKEIIEQYKGAGQEKIRESFSTISDYSSLFRDAGYEIGTIIASVSLPPDISVSFKCLEAVPHEEREGFYTKAEGSKVVTLILKSLFKASDFSGSLKVGDLKLSTIDIKLGLIPGINISFRK